MARRQTLPAPPFRDNMTSPSESQDIMFKTLVVGNSGAGKTSILKRLIYKSFSETYKATIGVDFGFYRVQFDDGSSARMMLYDIAGEERYNVLMRSYYKDARCAFVVADLESETLKEDLRSWKSSIDSKVQFPGSEETIPCFMLCNKCDIPNEVKDEDLSVISQELGFEKWYRTSALSGENLEAATTELAKIVAELSEKYCQAQEQNGEILNVYNEEDGAKDGEKDSKQKSGCC